MNDNVIREIPFLYYPVKYSNRVTVNPDGSIQSIAKINWSWSEAEQKYVPGQPEPITDAVLGMQYDHRVSWLEFDLTNLRWGKDETATGGGLKEEDYNKYVFKLYFQSLDGTFSRNYIFDGKTFYIPSSLTRHAAKYDIILTIINQHKLEPGFNHYNVEGENETFVSNMFTGTVIRSAYNPNSFVPIYLDTNQLKVLSKTPVDGALADDGKLIVSNFKIANKKDNYITYIGFPYEFITSKVEDFTMFLCFEYEDETDPGVKKVKATRLEPIDPNDEYDDQTYQYIAWIPYEVSKNAGTYNVMICGFYGEYVADGDESTISAAELESMFTLLNEEQTYSYNLSFAQNYPDDESTSYLTAENNVYTLNYGDPADTLAYLESSEDYYFYCSSFVVLEVEDNFLEGDVKTAGDPVTTGSYIGSMTSAFSNISSSDGLLLGTADGGVLFANYIEDEDNGN